MPLHDGKIVDFTLSYHPLLPPKSLWMGSIGQNSTFFQNSTNTNQQRHLYLDNMRGSRNFLSGGGGGPGSSTHFTVNRGGPMVLLHIFQGGPTFSSGGGGGPNANFYRYPYNNNLCFSKGGLDPLSPSGSANVQCVILARICSDEPVRPPFKLRNSKC